VFFSTESVQLAKVSALERMRSALDYWMAILRRRIAALGSSLADQSHMTRLFKEKLSMTPKEYRDKGVFGLFCSLNVQ
jgi:AraC family transcriptional regulator